MPAPSHTHGLVECTRVMECVARLPIGDRGIALGACVRDGSLFATLEVVDKPHMVARLVRADGLDAAAVASAAEAEARRCLEQRHNNIAEVYGAVCVRGHPAGLLVERVEPLPPLPLDPTTALTIVMDVAWGLAHIHEASPTHCYGRLALGRVGVRDDGVYVLCDAGLIAAALGRRAHDSAREDIRDVALLFCELVSGRKAPADPFARAAYLVSVCVGRLHRELNALVTRCVMGEWGVPTSAEFAASCKQLLRNKTVELVAESVRLAVSVRVAFALRARSPKIVRTCAGTRIFCGRSISWPDALGSGGATVALAGWRRWRRRRWRWRLWWWWLRRPRRRHRWWRHRRRQCSYRPCSG